MIVLTTTQRDADWFRARAGVATASRASDILAKGRGSKPSEARQRYIYELVAERITGEASQHYLSTAMQWGQEQEINARAAYSNVHRTPVDEVGFVRHDTLLAGCSPDGLIDWRGLIEIKCPFATEVHVRTLYAGMPEEHEAQIQMQLWITGRKWCDFVSYDPRMPAEFALYVQRVERDAEWQSEFTQVITQFLSEVDAIENTLRARRTNVQSDPGQ